MGEGGNVAVEEGEESAGGTAAVDAEDSIGGTGRAAHTSSGRSHDAVVHVGTPPIACVPRSSMVLHLSTVDEREEPHGDADLDEEEGTDSTQREDFSDMPFSR